MHVGRLVAALAAVFLLTACGTGGGSPPPSAPPVSSAPPSAPVSPAPPAASRPADVVFAVDLAGGTLTPSGATVEVRRGQSVEVRFTSDTAEASVHVHGYDKELDATPGQTATLTFVADQSGVFEAEIEQTGDLIAKLVVR